MTKPIIPEGAICGGCSYTKESAKEFTAEHLAFMYSQIANYLSQKNAKHLTLLAPYWNEEQEVFELIGYGQSQ